ncbi:hypothetical protein ACS0TY_002617 [Phlomoides rotata]
MDLDDNGTDLEGEDSLRVDELETEEQHSTTLYLMGKVISNKPFNAFGFLEAMKKVMNPPLGFTAKEIRKNLFSFQFQLTSDLTVVLMKEPWLFKKNIVALQELDRGEQPSAVVFNKAPLWIRIYDLPIASRNEKVLIAIASKCGTLIEIDPESINGIGRSARLKVRVDIQKPLKKGLNLEMKNSKPLWINFKYERLTSFCYYCGMLGHMKWECDLMEGEESVLKILDDHLSFGEWLRASPGKQARVSSEAQ